MDRPKLAVLADAQPIARYRLDKAWAGLDFVLREHTPEVGSLARGEYPLGRVPDPGGLELAYTRPGTVIELARWLSENERVLETKVRLGVDPIELSSLEVYPGAWMESERTGLARLARGLDAFVRTAAARESALLYVVGR